MKLEAGTRENCFINVPKIFLDGKDITRACKVFDSGQGWADTYELSDDGKSFKMIVRDGKEQASMVRLFGTITTEPPLPQLEATIAAVRNAIDYYENREFGVDYGTQIRRLVEAVQKSHDKDAMRMMVQALSQLQQTQ